MAVIVPERFGDLLDPSIKKIYNDTYQQQEQMGPMLYNMQQSDTSFEKMSSLGALGDLSPFKGKIAYDDFRQGQDVQFNHGHWTGGIQVERTLLEDDLFQEIMQKPRELALASSRTREKLAVITFNSAFTGTADITVDGVTIMDSTHNTSLCSNSHNLGTDALPNQTLDNLGTSTPSGTNVEATRRLMSKFVDDRGNKIQVVPDLLLAGRDNEEVLWQLISSTGQVDSAQNNSNFHYGKYKLAIWDYLDEDKWFMIDSQLMKISLFWFDRIPLEMSQDKDFDTMIAKWAVRFRASWGYREFRFVFGHDY